jgi:hypothetical protein
MQGNPRWDVISAGDTATIAAPGALEALVLPCDPKNLRASRK